MNLTVKRAIAAMLATLLIVCSFASCKKDDAGDEITRGTDAIAAPETTATTAAPTSDTTATTAAPATSNATTTTKKNTQGGGTGSAGGSVDQISNQTGLATSFIGPLINALGYNYDAKEGVFYTELDSWQRSGNYIKHYDAVAPLGNMTFLTTKVDFDYAGKNWRLQFWKGQYGPFGGAEIGVYYKTPGQTDELYFCADDDHLMYMTYDCYLTEKDYRSGNKFFTRGWQKHWWLTGFKVANVTPTDMVMSARIRTFDSTMRDAMEKGLVNAGFRKGDARSQMDTYRKSGFDFYILWHSAGETNYNNNR